MKRACLPAFAVFVATLAAGDASALDRKEVRALLKREDQRQFSSGDWKARFFLEQKRRRKNDIVYDGLYYRRDSDDRVMILFLKPKSERGKGYLRVNKNLWHYDARIGKWDRRTQRERIGGTNSNQEDFSRPTYSEDYTGRHVGDGRLGRYHAYKLVLRKKKNAKVAYPKIHMWVDKKSRNILKRQDFAESGKLIRTVYYPQWRRVFSKSKKAYIWYPREIRVFDEIEKGNRTTMLIRKVDLRTLPRNMFTKAWFESKSR